MKNRIFKSLLLCVAGISFATSVMAQSQSLSGTVLDEGGQPVIGASVKIKGKSQVVVTDIDGKFHINAEPKDVLVISYIGMTTKELPAGQNLRVTLVDDTKTLNDVVVIGYGSVKKKDLSGSVVAIKAEEMNRGAVTSPQELLQGKVPGLYVQPGDGAPGSGSVIRIRGGASLNATNDPLVVIDGIPVSNDAAPGASNALATINPNDIATFTVLKDASATAIYGSRASNGVIIITTKKGSSGKIKVTYNSTFSAKDPYNRVNSLDAAAYRQIINEQYPAGTAIGDEVQKLVGMYPEQSTDWQDAIFQTGLSTDQNVGISGKAGFLPFRVSLGYNTEKGTLKTAQYDRYTGSINLSPKFFDDHLSVDINVKGTYAKSRFADAGAIGAAAFFDPTKPVHAAEGDIHGFNGYWNWTNEQGQPNTLASVNPLGQLEDKSNKSTTKRSLGNIQLDYKIHGLEDLHANLNLGYDVATSTQNDFVNPGSFNAAKDDVFAGLGQGSYKSRLRRNQVLDLYMNYVKEIEPIKSNINIMAGYSWQHFYYSDLDQGQSNVVDKTQFGDVEGWTYNENSMRYIRNGSYTSPKENYLVSFYGRLNYDFMNRYLLTATIRRDGSSRFAKSNRWGTFPSGAFAWTISEEKFMENTRSVLSNLKLRVGYGITGQQDFSDYYLYITNYTAGINPAGQYLGTNLIKPNGYNPDLKWEQTATFNLGLDFGFLNNRINGSIEYYHKKTKDLLNTVSTAAGTNFINQITANVGSMKNEGIEFNINATAVQTRDFRWDVGYNFTWNTSKITKLTAAYNPEYPGIDAGSVSYGSNNTVLQKHQVGEQPSTFWLYQQVYDKDGKPVQNAFVDRNGDGQITEADRYLTGKSPMPKFYMGFSSEFKYKNWDLGFNLRANIGNYVYNAFAADNSTRDNFGGQGMTSNYTDVIYSTGFKLKNATEQRASDLFLENGSFLKMDNVTLGYSFDKLFKVLSGRVSFSVQNVFTITNYSGLDPECFFYDVSSRMQTGIDQNVMPRPRTYTLGLSLNF